VRRAGLLAAHEALLSPAPSHSTGARQLLRIARTLRDSASGSRSEIAPASATPKDHCFVSARASYSRDVRAHTQRRSQSWQADGCRSAASCSWCSCSW
jgi:hypothetical protein